MELVTVPRVPVLRTGHFPLESGEADFTREHLAAAVEAFANDPAVRAMRIRLELEDQGHADAAGMAAEADGGSAAGSGSSAGPAVGWADNYAVEGNTLYADLHVPEAVASAMPWAFPGRSIEGLFGYTTATGQTHDFIATGLLLLGTSWPGVTTLPDFAEVQAQAAAELSEVEGAAATFAVDDIETQAPLAAAAVSASMPAEVRHAAAGVGVTDLRMRWYAAEGEQTLDGLPESYSYATWYVVEQRVDDDLTLYVVVLDEATGEEWRFDVTAVSGSDVTFSAPRRGVMDWQDAPAAAAASASARPIPVRWSSRDESRTAGASSPSDTTTTEDDSPMTDEQRRALAVSLGLDPATATEADVHAAAAERATAETPPEGGNPPEGGDAGDGESGSGEGAEAGEPVGATARTVTISRERLAELEQGAADGAAARATQIRAERDAAVRAAIEDGRITPAEAGMQPQADGSYPEGWRRDLDIAPEVTARRLEALAPTRTPGTVARQGVTAQEGAQGGSARRVIDSIRARRGSTDHGKVTHR